MQQPRVRPIEAIPVEHEGQQIIILRDPTHISPATGHVSPAVLYVISLMDGTRTLEDIQGAFLLRTHTLLPSDVLKKLVGQLDQMHFLQGEGYERYVKEILARPARAAAHAGATYAAHAKDLRAQLDGYFSAEGGPGPIDGDVSGAPLRGVMSPHIDFQRGNVTYAHTWHAAAQSPPAELYLILGTCHCGLRHSFCVTPKSYETPLGALPTDQAFVAALERRGCAWAREDEAAHIGEHSIEFQAVMLRYLYAGHAEVTAVPVLVNGFPESIRDGRPPREGAQFQEFVGAALDSAKEVGKRVCVVAGVDLAHVGPGFGDAEKVTAERAAEVERADREMLSAVERVDADGFFESIRKDGDGRHVCGYGPIYTALSLLSADGTVKGRLVRYAQAPAPDDSIVSFAGVTFHSV